jgi:hypothetical protein
MICNEILIFKIKIYKKNILTSLRFINKGAYGTIS